MPRLVQAFRSRWSRQAGYRDVLKVAVPLILSTSAWSVQHFVDRMLLTWHSTESVAAVLPAGILNFTMMSLFLGTAGYVNTFVSQYKGAGREDRIGPSVWQGVYIAVVAGVVHLAMIPAAPAIFDFVGHAPAIRAQEVVYFRILCLGALPAVASAALAGFYSGRGVTWPIMWVNLASTGLNVALDCVLIFGLGPVPEMGIAGAAIATVCAMVFSLLAYIVLLSRPAHNATYGTLSGWRPDRQLFPRLMRYGLPSGLQFFLDVAGFSAFVLIVGKLGMAELAASNIALNVNTLAFMPTIGVGIAVTVLVGQELGRNRPDMAERSAWAGLELAVLYMGAVAASYVLLPALFLLPYRAKADPEEFAKISGLAVVLLRFVAVFSVFDAIIIVLSAAIKGAGDTRFVMVMVGSLSIGLLATPTYLALEVFGVGVFGAWGILTVYVMVLALSFFLRFKGGKWKSMRVIEERPPALPPDLPAAPPPEAGYFES